MKKRGKKIYLALKIFVPLLVGILPSFLFVALFSPYGPSIVNYVKFLANVKESWGAILSIAVISMIVYLIELKKPLKLRKLFKNKAMLVFFIVIGVLILALTVVQIYLYVNFTLRNDILIRISANKENVFFTTSPYEKLSVKISVTMNPFCIAKCDYSFIDLSSGEGTEGSMRISSILSRTKEYSIENERMLEGSQTLRKFSISCKSERTLLCYTKETESKRDLLITVNYQLDEKDEEFKESSKEEIISAEFELHKSSGRLSEIDDKLKATNKFFESHIDIEMLRERFSELNDSIYKMRDLWIGQEFSELRSMADEFGEIENFSLEVNNSLLNTEENIEIYNNLADELVSSRDILESVYSEDMSVGLCSELNLLTGEFNEFMKEFNSEVDLSEKEKIADRVYEDVNEFYKKYVEDENKVLCEKYGISDEKLSRIEIPKREEQEPLIFTLKQADPVCCLDNKCGKCCDESCKDKNYPIIFLHGININKALPADYSLDSFTEVKEKLEKEGYVNAGSIIIDLENEEAGIWGKFNSSVIVTGSYFFETYKGENNEFTVIAKTDESIETYASRLNNIIKIIKERTGKEKVIVVAHSMGAVVTRKYIQKFGDDDLKKVILITAPNHGIDDKVKDYCAVIGPKIACSELAKDSEFMAELNKGHAEIPIYNIIGIGCDMGDETGEGLVKNSSQYLEYANNYYIKGTCNELNFEFLHEEIIFPDKYPETYNLIYRIIKDE